jgi:tRNA(Ile)-lysidine synthase
MARPHVRLSPDIIDAVDAGASGRRCVVALGGGADSSVLLAAAAESSTIPAVRGVFVDHHLAGSGSLNAAARAVGETLGVPVVVLDAPVADGADLEARARRARYRAIEGEVSPDEVVMTGHTMDDQAETIVMRLVEGAGSTGLSGIPPMRDPWMRPLLGFTRAELRTVADTLALPYVDDIANVDPRFTRVRVRRTVMPVLEDELGKGVRSGLARSSNLLRRDDELLEAQAAEVTLRREADRVLIPVAPLATAHPAVASRICRRALRIALAGQPGRSSDVAAILSTADSGETGQLTAGLVATHDGAYIAIGPPAGGSVPSVAGSTAPSITIDVPIDLRRPHEWPSFASSLGAADDADYVVRWAEVAPPVQQGGRFTVLDASSVAGSIEVRPFGHGDRIDIEVGSTPVSELLRHHGVPADRRSVSLVIAVDAKIAAVVGVRTAAWAKPRAGKPCVIIERTVGGRISRDRLPTGQEVAT